MDAMATYSSSDGVMENPAPEDELPLGLPGAGFSMCLTHLCSRVGLKGVSRYPWVLSYYVLHAIIVTGNHLLHSLSWM